MQRRISRRSYVRRSLCCTKTDSSSGVMTSSASDRTEASICRYCIYDTRLSAPQIPVQNPSFSVLLPAMDSAFFFRSQDWLHGLFAGAGSSTHVCFVFAVPFARLSCMVAHAQVPTFVQRSGIPRRWHHNHTTLIFSRWHLTAFRMWCGCCVVTQHHNPHSGGATPERARSNDLTWLEDFLTSKWPGAQFTKYLTIYRKIIVSLS